MDGYVIIGTEMDTKSFDAQVDYIESQLLEIEHKLKQADMGFEVGDTQKLEAQYEKLVNQLGKLKQKQADLNKTDFSNLEKNIDKIGNSVSKTITKVGKWALAIFGIRTAYNAVRSAVSTLSQYNEQLATDIQYIQFALASVLQPVIERLVQLFYKLLFYVNYIAQAWFGINLFANASSKAMDKSSKSADKMKKSLAGFDEMNVIGDTSSGGAGGGARIPSMDLSNMQGEVPDWLKWIAENKDLILSVIAGITAGLLAWKLGLTALQSLGIGIAIAGIVYAIQAIIKYLKDPSWENFGQVVTGIGIAVAGVAIAIGAWPVAVAGAIVAVVGIIISNWEKIKKFFQDGIDWLTNQSDFIHNKFGDTIGNIYDFLVRTLQRGLDFFDLTFNSIKKIFDGIITFIKGVFTGNWKMAWEGIKQIFSGIWNWISGTAKLVLTGLIDKARTISSTVADVISGVFKAVVNNTLKAIENILNSPIRTINSLIKVINDVPGIDLKTLPTFKLPRLAVGGIVNMPGRGVPIGGAITGEAGAEGVIPLTDSQAMETLGQAIGRYITINASITNTMNGRIISRELQKINNNSDFARNS